MSQPQMKRVSELAGWVNWKMSEFITWEFTCAAWLAKGI